MSRASSNSRSRSAHAALITYDGGHDEGSVSEIVVSTEPLGAPPEDWLEASWRLAPAGSYVVTAPEGAEGWGSHFEQRPGGFVYVCRGTVCFDPVDDYNDLKTPLWSRV